MAKDMKLLQKMELTDEARTKLTALLEESKKTKKIASKKLVDTLDAVDATEEQTEQFYDVLEAAGVEIDVSDVLDLIGSADGLDSPTLDEIDAIENGVSRVHILDGRIAHCLLLEIFTNRGIGTAILSEKEKRYYNE